MKGDVWLGSLKRIVVGTILLGSSVNAEGVSDGFVADLSLAEKNEAMGRFPVQSLTVGDTGVLDSYGTCWRNGRLFVIGGLEVSEARKGSFNTYATRVPGNAISLEVRASGDVNRADFEDFIDGLYESGDCEFVSAWHTQPGQLIPVLEINGLNSVQALIENLEQEIGE